MKTRTKKFWTFETDSIDPWVAQTPGTITDIKVTTAGDRNAICTVVMVIYTEPQDNPPTNPTIYSTEGSQA